MVSYRNIGKVNYEFTTEVRVGKMLCNNEQSYEDILFKDILFATENIAKLNMLLVDKCNKYYNYDKRDKDKANWLNDWYVNVQNELLQVVIESILFNKINKNKLNQLDEIVDRYYDYFEFIENDDEDNENERYEEIFNTIIQVPYEIYMLLEINDRPMSYKQATGNYTLSIDSTEKIIDMQDILVA
jgi:hypothetical protein